MSTPHTVNDVTTAPTQATDPSIVLSLSDITFSYSNNTNILRDISLDFPSGSWSAIMGPSGSGKSTLLYCASGLLSPQHGHVICGTTDITTLKGNDLTTFRREHFGFVFQNYNLLPELTATQNVLLPSMFGSHALPEQDARRALADVGLDQYADAYPEDLSGGQRQRVAIARGLALHPDILFADEPTGALDSKTTREVMDLFRMASDRKQTVIMVTHDPNVAACADQVIFLVDGSVVGIHRGMTAADIALAFSTGNFASTPSTTEDAQ